MWFMGFDVLGVGYAVISYLIPFLFVLTLVVFFHELGHFLVARWCGVKVMVFSIGFGPQLFGFYDRHGTQWRVSAIPLGGYVKFFGDENAASVADHTALAAMTEEERRHSFIDQPVRSRAAIVIAGPTANFILAIVIFAGIFMLVGRPVTAARVDQVQPGSAAEIAGVRPGDVVVAIDGKPIEGFGQLQRIVQTSGGRSLVLTVDRGGARIDLKATPTVRGFCNGILGISKSNATGEAIIQRASPLAAIRMGAEETYFIVERSLCFVAGVVVGRESADQLGGPARIAQVSGEVWKTGLSAGGTSGAITSLLYLAGLLSASIGLLNLFPIPLLDGGHLLFYSIEAVRGKPLSERAQEVGFRIGLAIVVMLMIFATYNDILHLAAQWTAS
jgi:regulator of sigma E protease